MLKHHCLTSGLWGLINNAAINGLGDVELVAMETIKRVAEVNYYGMVRVTKTFLPMIKASKGNLGHITLTKSMP